MPITFHCFFEQSGTFKNEFKKLGYEAYDYDILDDFGETDYKVDLFKDIESAYSHTHTHTAFDNVKEGDQIIAFFPCTRFEAQVIIDYKGKNAGMKNWTDKQKLEYDLKLHDELHRFYCLVTKMVLVCIERKIPLIIENPHGAGQHYLTRYWCLQPSLIDTNRKDRGDWYTKPTQYWFINRKPSNNLVFDAVAQYPGKSYSKIRGNVQRERSAISPHYANRFIREFVI